MRLNIATHCKCQHVESLDMITNSCFEVNAMMILRNDQQQTIRAALSIPAGLIRLMFPQLYDARRCMPGFVSLSPHAQTMSCFVFVLTFLIIQRTSLAFLKVYTAELKLHMTNQ